MKPVAKKATAAELRNTLLLEAAMDVDESDMGWFSRQCDDIIAAARAEAVDEERDRIGSSVHVCGDHWHGLSGEVVDGSDGCPWCLAADRENERQTAEEERDEAREAVAPVLEVLRQLVEAMPKCEWDEYECKKVATHHAYKQQFFCAAHQFASDVQPVEWAAPLRAALALLAADKAGAKAGKP